MITNREGFTYYCLRNLGGGLGINKYNDIEITEEQLNDRIDEAIQFYNDNGYAGVQHSYTKVQIRASNITITTNNAETFTFNETITGSTSGATAIVTTDDRTSTGYNLIVKQIKGTFQVGETIIGSTSNITSTVSQVTIGLIDLQYIDMPSDVHNIVNILHRSGITRFDILSPEYKIMFDSVQGLRYGGIAEYAVAMRYLSTIEKVIEGSRTLHYDYNRLQNRLHINVDWYTVFTPGQYIIVECYIPLVPEDWVKMWNDRWIKHYATSLIKRQWGINLKKYSGVRLLDGITINGQVLYEEAMNEIKELEQDLINRNPPFIGLIG